MALPTDSIGGGKQLDIFRKIEQTPPFVANSGHMNDIFNRICCVHVYTCGAKND